MASPLHALQPLLLLAACRVGGCEDPPELCGWQDGTSLLQVHATLREVDHEPPTRGLLATRGQAPLTYKHLAKAGGTYIEGVLKEVIPESLLTIVDERSPLTAEVAEGSFVLGSIRNPCEYYPSLWAHGMSETCQQFGGCYFARLPEEEQARLKPLHSDPPFNTTDDVERFRAFVRYTFAKDVGVMSLRFWSAYVSMPPETQKEDDSAGTAGDAGRTVGAMVYADLSIPAFYVDKKMTPQERQEMLDELKAYHPHDSEVDCWSKVESLEEDLRSCLRLYEERGGSVLWDKLDGAIADASVHESEHADCKTYYDADTEALVRHGDKTIFEDFGYTTCCVAED